MIQQMFNLLTNSNTNHSLRFSQLITEFPANIRYQNKRTTRWLAKCVPITYEVSFSFFRFVRASVIGTHLRTGAQKMIDIVV